LVVLHQHLVIKYFTLILVIQLRQSLTLKEFILIFILVPNFVFFISKIKQIYVLPHLAHRKILFFDILLILLLAFIIKDEEFYDLKRNLFIHVLTA
jgi:hypothetical protein